MSFLVFLEVAGAQWRFTACAEFHRSHWIIQAMVAWHRRAYSQSAVRSGRQEPIHDTAELEVLGKSLRAAVLFPALRTTFRGLGIFCVGSILYTTQAVIVSTRKGYRITIQLQTDRTAQLQSKTLLRFTKRHVYRFLAKALLCVDFENWGTSERLLV